MFCSLAQMSLPLLALFACAERRVADTEDLRGLPLVEQKPADINSKALDFSKDKASGCGDFVVYTDSKDGRSQLFVSVNREELKLSPEPKEFDLGKAPEGLKVVLVTAKDDGKKVHFHTCDDQIFADEAELTETDIKVGKVKLQISTDAPKPGEEDYKVNVEMQGIQADLNPAESVELGDFNFKDIVVGWYAG